MDVFTSQTEFNPPGSFVPISIRAFESSSFVSFVNSHSTAPPSLRNRSRQSGSDSNPEGCCCHPLTSFFLKSSDLQAPLCVLHSSSFRFFMCPPIDLVSIESQQVTHVRVRQRKLIWRPLRPLQDAGSGRLILVVVELPVLGKLSRIHPFKSR